MFDIMSDLLTALSALQGDELRARLPDLFAAIDTADDATAPLLASLAARAFEGENGLATLRHEASLPFQLRGLSHPDSRVRALTATQLTRLASTMADITALRDRGILGRLAGLIGDEVLSVSERAAGFFAACAAAGPEALGLLLSHEPTLQALKALGGDGSRSASVLRLRAFALFASLAATGDAQFRLVDDRALLAPALALWRGDDPLVRLNAVELFANLARPPVGVPWLREHDILLEMCAVLDVAEGEDMLLDLLRPAVLGCLATILEVGGAPAATALLHEQRLVARLWPLLYARQPEQLIASLAVLKVAASTVGGMRATLALHAESAAADAGESGGGPLARHLRAHDERTRVGAMAVTAQLLESFADTGAAGAAGAAGGDTMDIVADAPTPVGDAAGVLSPAALDSSMRSLITMASIEGTTSAADAIAQMGRSLSDDVRVASLEVLHGIARVPWGAAMLCDSEGVLELLLTMESVHAVPAEELRRKHAVAKALAQWPAALESLGATAAAQIRAYAAAGPFSPQPARAPKMAAPLTL